MNDLIQITPTSINGAEVNSVNLRDLHKKLKLKSDFSGWAKRQLGIFVENEDYATLTKKVERQTLIEYAVTIDTAKHISMLQKNEVGMKIRRYFIESEKKNLVSQLPDFTNPAIAARAWADEVEAKLALEHKIVEKDKVIIAIADLNIKAGDVSVGDFAKNLAIDGLGRNNMYVWLKGRGFLQLNNEPYQQYVQRGYFKRKPYDEEYAGEVKYKTVLTPKGTVWLTKMLKAEYDLD